MGWFQILRMGMAILGYEYQWSHERPLISFKYSSPFGGMKDPPQLMIPILDDETWVYYLG